MRVGTSGVMNANVDVSVSVSVVDVRGILGRDIYWGREMA